MSLLSLWLYLSMKRLNYCALQVLQEKVYTLTFNIYCILIPPQVTFATFSTSDSSNSSEVGMYEMYSVRPDTNYVVKKLATWRVGNRVTLPKEDWNERRTNLTGLHLRCTTMPVNFSQNFLGTVENRYWIFYTDMRRSLAEERDGPNQQNLKSCLFRPVKISLFQMIRDIRLSSPLQQSSKSCAGV